MPSPSSQKRFAVLNNFGASGSNSALLLEEHLSTASPDIHDVPLVFGLSAKTEVAIRDLRNHYLKWLQRPENKSVSLSDVAYTSTARRQVYRHRLAFSVSDLGDLQQKLARADIVSVDDKPAQVAFVFSGQSGQYLGMGRALYESSPMFRNIVNECDAHLRWNGFSSVLPIITTETESIPDPATRFETYQTSQFVLQLALAKLWMSWGVRASAVIGHR
jgi:acyl transferase domain-containing protein